LNEDQVIELLRSRGALRSGHFLLSSGHHSDLYVEKARVFEDPQAAALLGRAISSLYEHVQAVVSPAVGAIPLGFAVALAAGARFVYAERVQGRLTLRRGFSLRPGERVLVVEDVITTGASAAEVHALVVHAGAHPLGVAALVDRSGSDPGFPLRAMARVSADSWDSESCPLCDRGVPVESPGSRHLEAKPLATPPNP
jgi:orotate phosphoribosyltransferase